MQVQFELFPLRSLLLGEYHLVSLPLPTWMLPFGRFPLLSERRRCHPRQEVLFGHLRIEACMRLLGAYRSLPRPSSVPKPSHPSGGVSCRTYFGTHTRLTFETYAWCHRDPQPLIDHLPFAS